MPFTEYAVLGDDIVIWNSKVAKTYLRVLKTLGVEVGLAKSVISKKGIGLEFAKKTFVNGSDLSPIPFKEQSAAHRSVASFRSFMEKYNMSLLKGLRFLGYGYKVDPSKRSRAVDLLHLALMVPRDHIDFSNILLDSLER